LYVPDWEGQKKRGNYQYVLVGYRYAGLLISGKNRGNGRFSLPIMNANQYMPLPVQAHEPTGFPYLLAVFSRRTSH